MEFKVYDGAAWRQPYEVKVYTGFFWRTVAEAWVYDGATWRQIYTTASLVPTKHQPISDISYTNWNYSAGSNYYGTIDEEPADNTDYVFANDGVTDDFEVLFQTGSDPVTGSGHEFRCRWKYNTGGGTPNDDAFVNIYLYQGTTLIKGSSLNVSTIGYDTWNDYTGSLSTAQADSITDYNDLRFRFKTNPWDSGTSGDSTDVSYATLIYPGTG